MNTLKKLESVKIGKNERSLLLDYVHVIKIQNDAKGLLFPRKNCYN